MFTLREKDLVRKLTLFIIEMDKIHPDEGNLIRIPKSTEHRI